MRLELKGVSHAYAGVKALAGVDLEVPEGSFTAIFGQNGAGKSTIAKIAGGMLRPTEGTVSIDGRPLPRRLRAGLAKRGVALIPEGRRLFSDLSIADNLRLGAYAMRLSRGELATRMDRAMELMPPELRRRTKERAGVLSGGERQMVAIARAMMADPSLVIVDEPSLGLAPIIVEAVYDNLLRLHGEGVTVVVIEQEAASALPVCSHVLVVRRGEIVLRCDKAENEVTLDDLTALYFGERHLV